MSLKAIQAILLNLYDLSSSFLIFKIILLKYVDLQCCINFCSRARQSFIHIYICIYYLLYSFQLWFITEHWTYSSLYYTVGSSLFILFITYLLKQTCIKVFCRASQVAQWAKILPAMQETWVRSLGWDDPVEKWMATHYSILAWRIPWTEEPVGL